MVVGFASSLTSAGLARDEHVRAEEGLVHFAGVETGAAGTAVAPKEVFGTMLRDPSGAIVACTEPKPSAWSFQAAAALVSRQMQSPAAGRELAEAGLAVAAAPAPFDAKFRFAGEVIASKHEALGCKPCALQASPQRSIAVRVDCAHSPSPPAV